jgi:hypothetical protein
MCISPKRSNKYEIHVSFSVQHGVVCYRVLRGVSYQTALVIAILHQTGQAECTMLPVLLRN